MSVPRTPGEDFWYHQGMLAEAKAREVPLRFRELAKLFDSLTERYRNDMDVADYTIILKLAQIMCPSKLRRRYRL